MKSKKEIQDELEKLSPHLAKLKKVDPFKVPDDYFAQMSSEVFEKIQAEQKVQTPSPSLSITDRLATVFKTILQPRYAVGFATVALLIAFVFMYNKDQPNTPSMLADNIMVEDAQQYLAEHIDEFDESLLLSLDLEINQLEGLTTDDLNDDLLEELIDDLDEQMLDELL